MRRREHQHTTVDDVAQNCITVLEAMGPILEATIGYKAQCEAAGFSPTASEQMAQTLHIGMVSKIFGHS